ncbi:MAG: ribose-phosphate pyrophosphokinase [Peptococcaceae bacterium]|jgi:ribose-phosphate pyrophosphokinase|nr:ribose-phosphate pyrophosphokinase [Peptococcaceae bacterium]MBQ2015195.1 ribose-phosphate pyrophosphokinase [Peptococcaceae bacterium]MBQ2035192.1 ribose-phosphate pyrophosphokinase [Peptococcaceae bacterium]MBQ2120850.1 ribose-phosphate pyrophosphokinase [Peptococcaceae bacterium]MBQ2448771.1 ribose-phosphate pyrophosphokinase [Peptococcaceae bacterium]
MTTEKKLGNLKLFTGNANPELAREIAEYIGTKLGDAQVKHFSDGEISIMIDESVRGDDVYIIQPTCTPVNDNMMELLIMIDAVRRASAKRITAVLPYYGYARQDRKSRGREPITAKLVANLITQAGARRVLAMDLHAQQIQGFFDIPLDNLMGLPILADYYKHKDTENLVVVSPDMGGVARARNLAEQIGVPLAIIDKRRPRPNVSEVMNIIGDIEGKEVILVDDMIDTAGTITNGAQALIDRGAKCVDACCTHAVLSGPAIERIEKSPIQELVTTNTIPLGDKKCDKIKVLSVAPVIGEAILRIHNDRSVSDLFR